MTDIEAQASAAFAVALAGSKGLQELSGLAGFAVARQTWMLGWAEGMRCAFVQAQSMFDASHHAH